MIFFSIISCSYGSLSNKKTDIILLSKSRLKLLAINASGYLTLPSSFYSSLAVAAALQTVGHALIWISWHVSPPDCISPAELQLLAWAQVLIHLPKIGSWWSPCAGVLWRFKKQWFILLVIFCTEGSLAN